MTTIGITMGCPAGIGPEIILKYFSSPDRSRDIGAVVLGDPTPLQKAAAVLGLPAPKLIPWQPGEDLPVHGIPLLTLSSLSAEQINWGKPNLDTARAMASYIETAVELATTGAIDGITTCPISKAALNSAGYSFPGHTEMLGSLTGTDKFVMMMSGSRLRVTLVTIHCAFTDIATMITEEGVHDLIVMTHGALRSDFGINNPRLAVAGLNPHGGEDALFGKEEITIITPAIARAKQKHIDVSGPYPPDTIFYKAAEGFFDAVICMYHDQGLIPFKLLHFDDGVNVTLGLPIVRTSVDHGTAYDIAGQGVASCLSLREAVELAASIAHNRHANMKG